MWISDIALLYSSGVTAGEGAKIMDQMRLVEVSAIRCKPGPIHGQSLFIRDQQSVETPYAAEQFRCEANLLSKQLIETGVTEPGFQLYLPHAAKCIFAATTARSHIRQRGESEWRLLSLRHKYRSTI